MKYLLAVSGGIDSVVMLDQLARQTDFELIVAHFDHGIRTDSAADARFVEALAKKYNLKFEVRREELGSLASEEKARERRHAFLDEVAKKHDAVVATAHHKDDVIETITINLSRGTGWRGLAVFGNEKIIRPQLHMTKLQIRDYALKNNLEWVEDETNQTAIYLRNKLRFEINKKISPDSKQKILDLWTVQLRLRQKIELEADQLLLSGEQQSRYFFSQIDESCASEMLWSLLGRNGQSLTQPQRVRLLHAIKTAKTGNIFEAGGDARVRFSQSDFVVETH